MNNPDDCYISVDIEAAGPVPHLYSMLSLGACLCDADERQFEILFKPISKKFVPEAIAVSGFNLEDLQANGADPQEAIRLFSDWVVTEAEGRRPVFVGLNAAFDWAFVNYYFVLFDLENPFGFAPIDIKAFFMGRLDATWKDSTSKKMSAVLGAKNSGNHKALTDAIAQAELFRLACAKSVR